MTKSIPTTTIIDSESLLCFKTTMIFARFRPIGFLEVPESYG
jgi:hypothetical protein